MRTSTLASVRDERGEIVALDELGGGMLELTVHLPHLAATAQPGQFAQLRRAGATTPLLRRPFSVAWTEGEMASFVFAPVGAGTRLLAGLDVGEGVDALGPLGSGFTIEGASGTALCVSGGLGCAPFPLLVRRLREYHAGEVVVLSGAATADLLYPPERFRRGDEGVRVVELTVDGSRGRKALVTEAVAEERGGDTAVFACGPNPMLAALWNVLLVGRPPVRAEASLEAPMGCGYGTCLGCALPVLAAPAVVEWALCCRQGPVMDMAEVAWDELMTLPPAHVA